MSSRTVDARGSVSAFVTCIVGALVTLSLLMFETGRYIDRYLEVSDVAENASRVGAQSIVGIRAGTPHIDQRSATLAANRFLGENGLNGHVRIDGLRITVSVSTIWRPIGVSVLGERRIALSRSASVFGEG